MQALELRDEHPLEVIPPKTTHLDLYSLKMPIAINDQGLPSLPEDLSFHDIHRVAVSGGNAAPGPLDHVGLVPVFQVFSAVNASPVYGWFPQQHSQSPLFRQ
jgi:hypothetical protein